MPRYSLDDSTNVMTYIGKVVSSKVGPASEAYQKASGGRAGEQWHIEIEPLSPFVYEGHGTRSNSVNLPVPGMKARTDSALIGRYNAYKALGFNMPTDDDFALIEGKIFVFTNEARKFGNNEKMDDWPTMAMPDDWKPEEAPVVIASRKSADGSSGSSGGDPWVLAADAMNEKPAGKNELMVLMGTGKQELQGHAEIMTLVQKNGLTAELVKRSLGKIEDGKFLVSV